MAMYCLSLFNQEQVHILTYLLPPLPPIKHTSFVADAITLVYKSENTGFAVLHKQLVVFQEVVQPWASEDRSISVL